MFTCVEKGKIKRGNHDYGKQKFKSGSIPC